MRTYKLVGHTVVPCDFTEAYMERFAIVRATGEDPWRVAHNDLGNGRSVSTVFLGLDHNPFGGEPRLFETAIFGPKDQVDVVGRCATWEQAEEQHAEAVKAAKTGHLRVVK